MNRFFYFLTLLCSSAVLLYGCDSSKATVGGRFLGGGGQTVYVEKVSALSTIVVDSMLLPDDGAYQIKIEDVADTPMLYNVIFDNERIPLLLQGGDNVYVSPVCRPSSDYSVSGSRESDLLAKFNIQFQNGMSKLNAISAEFANQNLPDDKRDEVKRRYAELYQQIKRDQLRFILENKSSIAAVYALNQRLPGDRWLFIGENDFIYYREVADAVEKNYPTSPYIMTLRSEISQMETRMSLMNKISEVTVPDLEIPNVYGRVEKLSSLRGRIVLLDFWSAELGNSNALNTDLKSIYDEFSADGFEVYQVSFDTRRLQWLTAVQEQKLPWISVSDLKGNASPVLGLYNISQLPSNYLLDRSGNIIGRDLYGDALRESLQRFIQK